MSWPPRYQGLLTDDYGIVTLADLDEDGQQDPWTGFTGDDVDHYWQCLEPKDYFFDCENLGKAEPEGWDIGELTFWIQANGQFHHFYARHNWSIEYCQDLKTDILWLLKDETVVCISGTYIDTDQNGINWILDRVKTRKGSWSWFEQAGYNLSLPSQSTLHD